MLRKKRGFSFIEVLIFCFISVILMTLIVSMVSNSRDFSRTMGCINNMRNITQAIEQYQGDWNESPLYLSSLYPRYLASDAVFHCPSDRIQGNSYDNFYISREITEKDANKMLLVCHRHQKRNRTVTAYLSYAVDVNKSQEVSWANMPAEFGEVYSGGVLTFSDGTQVEIIEGEIVLLSSFEGSDQKNYSAIYIPEEKNTTIEITHHTDSRFEVITPAVIAGVEGTKFQVSSQWTDTSPPSASTSVTVSEGIVSVQERAFGRTMELTPTTSPNVQVTTAAWEELPPGLRDKDETHPGRSNFVSRRPPRVQPQINLF